MRSSFCAAVADQISGVVLVGHQIGTLAIVDRSDNHRAVRVALDETQHHPGAVDQWEVMAVVPAGIRLGEANRPAGAAGAPAIQIERQLHAVFAGRREVGVLVVARRHDLRGQQAVDAGPR